MQQKIYKYGFCIDDEVVIKMPKEAQILTIQIQKGTPCIWAIVNPSNPIEDKKLCLRGTGHSFNGSEGKYIGTFQMSSGDLVFHLFEKIGDN